jgi:hypothetical protein
MKNKYKVIIGIAAFLIVIRLFLPYIVLYYANRSLENMKGYSGHIDDIDLSIYRGAYNIDDIYLNKVDTVTKMESNFFKSKNIDLSVEWSSIFHGSIVGELELDSPVLIFTKDKVELNDLKKDTADFRNLLKTIMPLKINRFEVNNGGLHYIDQSSKTIVDVALKQMHILALNLSNVIDDQVELPSTVVANALVYEGTLTFDMKLNALNKYPTFDLNAEVKDVNLVLLNDFLKAYGNFDVNKGTFGLYTEMVTRDGKFKGYLKPIIEDLDVVGPKDKGDNFFNQVYEQLVGTAGVILENQKEDQVATKVNLEGDFKNPQANTFEAIWELLRNAFIQALIPSIDHNINLKSVDSEHHPEDKKGLLHRIFN